MDLFAYFLLFVKTSWLLGLGFVFLRLWRTSRSQSSKASATKQPADDMSRRTPQKDVNASAEAGMTRSACCAQSETTPPAATTVCCKSQSQPAPAPAPAQAPAPAVRILYGSTKGTCKHLATQLAARLAEALPQAAAAAATAAAAANGCGAADCCRGGGGAAAAPPSATDIASYEPEQLLSEAADSLVVVVISTYEGGTPPKSAQFFCRQVNSWLEDAASDFRLGSGALSHLRFAVWGCGNSLYERNFNAVARRVDRQLRELGARRFRPLGLGDEDAAGRDLLQQFGPWAEELAAREAQRRQPQQKLAAAATAAGPAAAVAGARMDAAAGAERTANGGVGEEEEEEEVEDGEEEEEEEEDEEDEDGAGSEVDIEDIGGAGPRRGKSRAAATTTTTAAAAGGPPEMLNPLIRGSLTKQGYKLIGSHSGVKMCRWTKSMLRGRGGCYKHAFYGIESHRCMEATPSLACANKCVFCWRHHSNPVGKTWKWAMDPADTIVETALELHTRMVREYSGVPGVKPEAVAEGLQVRHCALSLVGEPIMYPEINGLVDQLHGRGISTFLVTNAQFPDRIQQLKPVTQLYVSVDAATPESLKAVDRPLFSDYWDRFTGCLSALASKRQRTVYRLTLVKGWNMSEVAAYASLVDLGRPDFIEIKGVTYCGAGAASSLTMANVPYHADVVAFGQAICEARGGEYALACEHAHSCCILLARVDKFLIGGRWHTWIDYDKFQRLVKEGGEFGAEDYMLPTPSWAVFGATEAGFDPLQQRVKKVRRHPGKSGGDSTAAPSVAGDDDGDD
ncbi:hypothetical protein PLESTB_000682600 [Pleodorina starrii]|uniref:tRNA 4-demethylwyosine synthase (AdoMet-dependent) n=1 Tax=Pleodorina starrii TaxID=330485 RepID=A0A9W6BJR5_9CHLO|nr:hypothetical protein PLESTM_001234400 [Pleodorina starrii]GLC52867.1 hypothetical protein PLESTB_000682600 [Pleodorina starrii]